MMKLSMISFLVLTMALSACGTRDRDVVLSRIKNTGDGPDAFAISPGKPLQEPESYSALPEPVPGGVNLTDSNPIAEGVAALGGNDAVRARSGISAADGTLVNHSRRFGVSSGIRTTLREEDIATRRQHGRINILFRRSASNYANAYREQWLNSEQENNRLRNLGIPTPTAPPPARNRLR